MNLNNCNHEWFPVVIYRGGEQVCERCGWTRKLVKPTDPNQEDYYVYYPPQAEELQKSH